MKTKELNIKTKMVKSEPAAIKTNFTIEVGEPEYGMARQCWKMYGINSEEEYEQWKKDMVEKWHTKNEKRK